MLNLYPCRPSLNKMETEKEYEFNQSIATLKRIDDDIKFFKYALRDNPDKVVGFNLIILAGEMRPLLKDDVQKVLDKYVNKIGSANYTLEDVRQFFYWLIQQGHNTQVLFLKSGDVIGAMRR